LKPIVHVLDIIELWKIGRWVLAINVLGYVFGETGKLMTLGFLGTAGVAVLELGRQIVSPANLLLQGTANLWHPRLVETAETKDKRQFMKTIWRVTLTQMCLGFLILLVIIVAAPHLIPLLVPGKEEAYKLAAPIAMILSLAMIGRLFWQHFSFGIIALGKPNLSSFMRVIAVSVMLPLGYILIKHWGLIGAAWNDVAGQAVVLVLSVLLMRKAIRERK
jgi:O-antigen/teichoic acid export membrane protein